MNLQLPAAIYQNMPYCPKTKNNATKIDVVSCYLCCSGFIFMVENSRSIATVLGLISFLARDA